MAPRTAHALTETIAASVSIEERKRLVRGANESGQTLSAYVRSLVSPAAAPATTPGAYAAGLFRALLTSRKAADDYTRALQHQGTGDNLGVVPTPIADDLVAFVAESRPVVSASRRFSGPKPMPAGGKTFQIGRVTQRTTDAEQAAEFDLLSSQKLTVAADTVTKKTYGGTLSISEQEIDWTDGGDGGGALDDIYEDLAAVYGDQTEAVACAAVEAAATTTVTPTLPSPGIHDGLARAAASVLSTAKVVPDAIFAAPDQWEYLLGLVDDAHAVVYADGRPLTLPIVVSPAFTSGFLALAATKFVKTWEHNKGPIAVPAPNTLELVVAYRGYFVPKVYAQGLCKLVQT